MKFIKLERICPVFESRGSGAPMLHTLKPLVDKGDSKVVTLVSEDGVPVRCGVLALNISAKRGGYRENHRQTLDNKYSGKRRTNYGTV